MARSLAPRSRRPIPSRAQRVRRRARAPGLDMAPTGDRSRRPPRTAPGIATAPTVHRPRRSRPSPPRPAADRSRAGAAVARRWPWLLRGPRSCSASRAALTARRCRTCPVTTPAAAPAASDGSGVAADRRGRPHFDPFGDDGGEHRERGASAPSTAIPARRGGPSGTDNRELRNAKPGVGLVGRARRGRTTSRRRGRPRSRAAGAARSTSPTSPATRSTAGARRAPTATTSGARHIDVRRRPRAAQYVLVWFTHLPDPADELGIGSTLQVAEGR